jgi:hypothetical protein
VAGFIEMLLSFVVEIISATSAQSGLRSICIDGHEAVGGNDLALREHYHVGSEVVLTADRRPIDIHMFRWAARTKWTKILAAAKLEGVCAQYERYGGNNPAAVTKVVVLRIHSMYTARRAAVG